MGIVCIMSKALLGWFYTIEFSYFGSQSMGIGWLLFLI